MYYIHTQQPLAVHSWDWRSQPTWSVIVDTIRYFQQRYADQGVAIEEVETGGDEYAIVLGPASLTEQQASETYQQACCEGAPEYLWLDKGPKELSDFA
ncbi:hypothetical protein FAES_4037 [Fibrella aestuarina BUZ 2]|uniref:Uncharacterized protein n=1 Tax=Fibrella aestuarina BUZ 2 TaxID=1166018 RepID=I0KD34_9BACT|nr:hypothetical protein [Fibrella aestuarina]CCH02037.1 hypothetical protein FAES_4037 [Fibrella aestuarina BUZ 2]